MRPDFSYDEPETLKDIQSARPDGPRATPLVITSSELGVDFEKTDVTTEWLTHLPYFSLHTTERAVYRNLV
ncbi:MAG: hypothetical protein ACP5JG_13835 [Anaerolineae bacterium]